MELIPQVAEPDARSSSATRRAGFGSAARSISGPVLVFPDRTEAWAEPAFTAEGLAPVLAHGGVELLLLGLGRRIAPVSAALRSALKAGGIAVEPMDTGAACRTYNMLVGRGPPRRRRAAAAGLNRPARNLLRQGHHRVEPRHAAQS